MAAPRIALLAARASWLSLLAAVPAADALLAQGRDAVTVVGAVMLWTAWAIGLVATLVPSTIGLTAVRLIAPGAPVLAAWSALEASAVASAFAAVSAIVLVAVVFSPVTGAVFVQGSAYGDESRHLLRAPGQLLLGPIPLAWAVTVAGVASGPLLLASERWALGIVACLLGLPAAAVCATALHRLSRRWLVLVPAGLVLHDPFTLAQTAMFPREVIDEVRPALRDSPALEGTPSEGTALDCTALAPGLALEARFRRDQTLLPRPRTRGAGASPGGAGGGAAATAGVPTRGILFTPTRPGAVLAAAAARRLPVGRP